jgi:hypothetical protein
MPLELSHRAITMTWIAFDEKTRNAAGEILGAPVKLAPTATDPLDYALASPHNSVVLAPYGEAEHLVVLTVKKNVREQLAPPPPATQVEQTPTRTGHYVSGGFLGLNDEVELEEPEQRKSWWKRLFD